MYFALWSLATLFILYAGTIPFNFTNAPADVAARLAALPLNPFISPDTGRRLSIPDVVQNLLLFAPFGILGLMAMRSRGTPAWRALLLVTAGGATLSAVVETLQLFTIDRTTSLSDVMANTSGTFAGALAAHVTARGARRVMRALRAHGLVDVPAFYPLAIAAIVVAVAAWEPFDFTLDVGTLVGRVRALRADPWQFVVLGDEGVEMIRYACFGLATCAWLQQLGVRRYMALAAVGGAAVALGLEASQWIIGSRMPGLADSVVHVSGVLVGVAVGWGWPLGARPVAWTAGLWVATGLAAALDLLSPFTLGLMHRPITWLPFGNYYQRTTFETLSHSLELLLLYFPFAFAAGASAHLPRRGLVAAVVGTVAIAAPLEYLQGAIVGRYGDVTDVALAALGAAFGAWVGGAAWSRYVARTPRWDDGLTDPAPFAPN